MNKIIFIEPQCIDIVHVNFNSSIIVSFLKATLISNAVLISEYSHAQLVQNRLLENDPSSELSIVPFDQLWSNFEYKRYIEEYFFIKHIISSYTTANTQYLVFLSTSRSMLIALKHFFSKNKCNLKVLAIPHAILKEVEGDTSKRFWNFPFKIKRGINLKCPDNLKFIALTGPIYDNILKQSNPTQWIHLDHPIPLRKMIISKLDNKIKSYQGEKLTIGIFGSINYEFTAIKNLLKEIKELNTHKIEIKIIGHITPNILSTFDPSFLDYYSKTPVSNEDYNRLAGTIDIALWLINPYRNRYVASATILDIFNFEIPIIYKQNQLIEYYSSLMGEIGFKVKNNHEILTIIRDLLQNSDEITSNIIKYKENMRKSVSLFSAEATSLKIKEILLSNA